ncbi:MAG: hypothetical protein CNLJKLNK_00835 [Holosporales bacterium]
MYFLFIAFIIDFLVAQTRDIIQNGVFAGQESVWLFRSYAHDQSPLVTITNNSNVVLQLDITILYSDIRQINNITFLRCLHPQSTIKITMSDFVSQFGEKSRLFSPRGWHILEHAIHGVCIDERYKERVITWLEAGDKHTHYTFKSSDCVL